MAHHLNLLAPPGVQFTFPGPFCSAHILSCELTENHLVLINSFRELLCVLLANSQSGRAVLRTPEFTAGVRHEGSHMACTLIPCTCILLSPPSRHSPGPANPLFFPRHTGPPEWLLLPCFLECNCLFSTSQNTNSTSAKCTPSNVWSEYLSSTVNS